MQSAYTSEIEQSLLKWNGCNRDISIHDAIRFYCCHVTMFSNLIGTANFLAVEVTVWTCGSCQAISPTAWEQGYEGYHCEKNEAFYVSKCCCAKGCGCYGDRRYQQLVQHFLPDCLRKQTESSSPSLPQECTLCQPRTVWMPLPNQLTPWQPLQIVPTTADSSNHRPQTTDVDNPSNPIPPGAVHIG